jgi:prepilin-type N-terminal cleavage/methylation domain-containing protein
MHMNKIINIKGGFTLVEVLVSVGIMLIFIPFAASMLTNSQLLTSYSKHKVQAAYVAQQLIEAQRPNIAAISTAVGPILTTNPSVKLGSGPISTTNPYVLTGFVTLDTKGVYPAVSCSSGSLPCGTATVTVTPAVYTALSGSQVTSTVSYHFVVKIIWTEQILNLQVPMTETYAEDIANDPMLN